MYYYAFQHNYGINTRDAKNHRIGYVLAFRSKRDRDKYVKDEIDAEAIDHKTARWHMLDLVAANEFCAPSDIELNTRELLSRYNFYTI